MRLGGVGLVVLVSGSSHWLFVIQSFGFERWKGWHVHDA